MSLTLGGVSALAWAALVLTGVFVGATPQALAQQEVEPELTVSKLYGISRSRATVLPEYTDFKDFREADYAALAVDDPRLKSVYLRFFEKCPGPYPKVWRFEDHIKAAYNDLIRRGNSVTPMLIQLMRDNPYSGIESSIFRNIRWIDTIDPEPYLDHARDMFLSRYDKITPGLAANAADLLIYKGTSADAEMLRKIAKKRPYMARNIEDRFILKNKPLPAELVAELGERIIFSVSDNTAEGNERESVSASGNKNFTSEDHSSQSMRQNISKSGLVAAGRWSAFAGVLFVALAAYIFSKSRSRRLL